MQFQISKELNKLLQKFGRDELKKMLQSEDPRHSFLNYHKAAQDMLNDAYSKERQKIIGIIKMKRQDSGPEAIRHRGKYMTKELMKAITDLTIAHPELNCLDFRIWGITGSATNIAEAWLNMMGPFIKKQNKSTAEASQSPAESRVPRGPPREGNSA